jgi:hypothetical protein
LNLYKTTVRLLFVGKHVSTQINRFYFKKTSNENTNVHEKNIEKMFPTKNQLFLLLLLTVIQCKQRYIRTSLPCNVTVVDLKKKFDFQSF